MRISYNWLCEFLPAKVAPADLAKELLLIGFEVAELRRTGAAFSGVVVGEILDIRKHPNADRLSLCQVTDGKETLSIVCGAKNVAVGQRVPVARIGATLPGGRSIERAKIRGTESQGMICSASELGLAAADGEGICVLPPDAPVGQDAAAALGEADWLMEVEITPNRPDCLSHFGLARELAVHYNLRVNAPKTEALPQTRDSGGGLVRVEEESGCSRYIGRLFQNVRVGPSPGWLAGRLEAVGLKPKNNIVDITNYVLFELGHPLHAFDAAELDGGKVVVRLAADGERLRALDANDYVLTARDLVIADAAKPAAIAGIMGGAASAVTDDTRSVLLEAACFAPELVRKTSQRLRLRSDSSYRFERGLDPESAALASARAAGLILKLCGRPVAASMADAYPAPPAAPPIAISAARVNEILGTNYAAAKVDALLRSIDESASAADAGIEFHPPPHRLDLRTPWDLAEEVGRHLGYESIGSEAAPVRLQRPKTLPIVDLVSSLRRRLEGLGFLEAYNYDFLSEAELRRASLGPERPVEVLNPLSEEWACLRPRLLPGLMRNAAFNFHRGVKGLRLYEIGKRYWMEEADILEATTLAGVLCGAFPARPDWRSRPPAPDKSGHFYEAKGLVAGLLSACPNITMPALDAPDVFFHPRASISVRLGPTALGAVGLLAPSVCAAWDMPEGSAAFDLNLDALAAFPIPAARFKPYSVFPSVTRDLSVVAAKDIAYLRVEECLQGLANLRRLELVDKFEGEGIAPGKKSLTLRLTFGAADKTLRDEEVNAAMKDALARIENACGGVLRS